MVFSERTGLIQRATYRALRVTVAQQLARTRSTACAKLGLIGGSCLFAFAALTSQLLFVPILGAATSCLYRRDAKDGR